MLKKPLIWLNDGCAGTGTGGKHELHYLPRLRKGNTCFGESHIDEIAQKHGVETVARMPIDPALAAACDAGTIESFNGTWLDGVLEKLTTENK